MNPAPASALLILFEENAAAVRLLNQGEPLPVRHQGPMNSDSSISRNAAMASISEPLTFTQPGQRQQFPQRTHSKSLIFR